MTHSSPFGMLLFEAITAHRHYLRRNWDRIGVTEAESRAIMYLSGRDGISQAALAKLLHVKPITIARLIDKLEAGRYIDRRPDAADRRAHRLYLTLKGRKVVTGVRRLVTETGDLIARDLPADHIAILGAVFEHMRKVMQRPQMRDRLLNTQGHSMAVARTGTRTSPRRTRKAR